MVQVSLGGLGGGQSRGQFSPSGGNVDFSAPDLRNVNFYTKAVPDPEQSRQRGRPWAVSKVFVRIQHPGEKDYTDREVKEDDIAKHMWPRQWDAYQRAQEQVPDGTPVECLFPQSPEIPANLHTIGIHTVQQLAGLTAHGVQTVGMGATQWQQAAKNFLAHANGGAGFHRLTAENEKLKNSLETQANQIALMKAQLDQMMAQKNQGISPAMIPAPGPNLAQAHALDQRAFQPIAELSDEPMFVEEDDSSTDGLAGPEIGQPAMTEAPRRRGRPPKQLTQGI